MSAVRANVIDIDDPDQLPRKPTFPNPDFLMGSKCSFDKNDERAVSV